MLAGPKRGGQWEKVGNWTQGEKRGRGAMGVECTLALQYSYSTCTRVTSDSLSSVAATKAPPYDACTMYSGGDGGGTTTTAGGGGSSPSGTSAGGGSSSLVGGSLMIGTPSSSSSASSSAEGCAP
eukprot:1191077-Prorocentrum_minimum.AAC.6